MIPKIQIPYLPHKHLQLAGDEIINFTPKIARKYTSKSETPLFANTKDWDDIKETIKPRWEQIHKLNIEPKKKSLLWRVLHNAIYTNKFFNIINIKNSPYCNLCKNKIETSSHIFYNCKRANDFWNLAKDFFNTIKKDNIEITIGKRDIIQGLESLKNTIPNHLVVLTLALWEIFRARAEANLTKSSPSGTQIFQRWKAILKRQIIRDWKKIPYKTNPWAKIETKWFAIEPGAKEQVSGYQTETEQVLSTLPEKISEGFEKNRRVQNLRGRQPIKIRTRLDGYFTAADG
ncbi:hypothetical protein BB560_005923 [Smittium megazygosporum]|uniref:Reverse transcriptase zinc-binding domain-containing protein n=1 Tax=Smittium megazygosporum TaxID=133381 RepID=A0A2T9YQR8_9FUNG|nr:hypothetical protein BB560_005923 [Smittium megazygosporum]